MKKIGLLAAIVLLLIASCNSKSNNSSKEESIMYESTPLAKLMLKMHGDAFAWKGAIETDVFESNFPVDHHGIYTVEATDPSVRNDEFILKADAYIAAVKDLCETEKQKKQVKKFNLMILSCIDCHAIYCQGPIDKIKKLYIAEE